MLSPPLLLAGERSAVTANCVPVKWGELDSTRLSGCAVCSCTSGFSFVSFLSGEVGLPKLEIDLLCQKISVFTAYVNTHSSSYTQLSQRSSQRLLVPLLVTQNDLGAGYQRTGQG